MATCGYNGLMTAGIRELKNDLSHYVRQVKKGKRIAITEHGRVVAELVPPQTRKANRTSRYDELVAKGIIIPAKKSGPIPPLGIKNPLPPGTALAELEESRNEDHEWP